ncbi:hypothetical protein LOSG293_120320 [Secundilactobacillus oryzae JCM 18671]|uniref:Galactose mutarotase n=1 Tax=Secundilactobacillus oryzae JCM 18671 TaxID=1291743 RepID=A0A081BIC7_9LACO|nr:aldose 1-epimerase family protein [Secundilactobacillus oryzae]GAK47795.1 hypothetical protein LOSG293_120320 [Secundilactobacillus oryzae JCM 18671]
MITLKNDYLTVKINEVGAELTSVVDAESQAEYMWQGSSKSWNRHAPILFPIVGRLQDDTFTYDGQEYHMGQHGFARDHTFEIETVSDTLVTLKLASSTETREKYPFDFVLRVTFELKDHVLSVQDQVTNTSTGEMLFSLGGHPGFNVPFDEPTADFTDYQVTVSPRQVYTTLPLKGASVDVANEGTLDLNQPLKLDHELFDQDAKILKLNEVETTVMLSSTVNDHGVALTVQNAPYLGIWSAYPNTGNFVCIEPWWGIADPVGHNGELKDKLGMRRLAANETESFTYQVSYF